MTRRLRLLRTSSSPTPYYSGSTACAFSKVRSRYALFFGRAACLLVPGTGALGSFAGHAPGSALVTLLYEWLWVEEAGAIRFVLHGGRIVLFVATALCLGGLCNYYDSGEVSPL